LVEKVDSEVTEVKKVENEEEAEGVVAPLAVTTAAVAAETPAITPETPAETAAVAAQETVTPASETPAPADAANTESTATVVKETEDDVKADALASPEMKPVIAAIKELLAQNDKKEAQETPAPIEKQELEYQATQLVNEAQSLDAQTEAEVTPKSYYY